MRANRRCSPGAASCRDAVERFLLLRVTVVWAVVIVAAATIAVDAVHAASNVVQYTYDAAGNIVAIGRSNQAPISISGFTPDAGSVGALVAIAGNGFSAAATV